MAEGLIAKEMKRFRELLIKANNEQIELFAKTIIAETKKRNI